MDGKPIHKDAWHRVLAGLGIGLIRVGFDGIVAAIDEEAAMIVGCAAEEALGRPILEVMPLEERIEPLKSAGGVDFDFFDDEEDDAMIEPKSGEEALLKRADGQRVWIAMSVEPFSDNAGDGQLIAIRQITGDRLLAMQVDYLRRSDNLTGLLSREGFISKIGERLNRTGEGPRTLVWIDLDRFDFVNLTGGHQAGDDLLSWVAAMIREWTGANDIIARVGDDEFAMFLYETEEVAAARSEKIRTSLERYHFTYDDQNFAISASIGVVPITEEVNLVELLSAGAGACARAKEEGRNRVVVHRPGEREENRRKNRMEWVSRIKRNLQEGKVILYGQPIQPLHGIGGLYFEVLMRTRDGHRISGPGEVIYAAERYDMMPMLDRWIITETLTILSRLPSAILSRIETCSLNLSGLSLRSRDTTEFLASTLISTGVPPEKICFEITETSAIDQMDEALYLMEEMKAIGCRFALDDFGSGAASYSYLKELPVDVLKIDGCFVSNLSHSKLDRAMVESINQIAHLLGMKTVGEMAATHAQVESLRELGVDYAQGHYVCPPMALDDLLMPTMDFDEDVEDSIEPA